MGTLIKNVMEAQKIRRSNDLVTVFYVLFQDRCRPESKTTFLTRKLALAFLILMVKLQFFGSATVFMAILADEHHTPAENKVRQAGRG